MSALFSRQLSEYNNYEGTGDMADRIFFYNVQTSDGDNIFWSKESLEDEELKRRVHHYLQERDEIASRVDEELARVESSLGLESEGDYHERIVRAVEKTFDPSKSNPLGEMEAKLWWFESWGMDTPDIHPMRTMSTVLFEAPVNFLYPDEDTWRPTNISVEMAV